MTSEITHLGHVTKLFLKSESQHEGNKQMKKREFLAKSCVFSQQQQIQNIKFLQILHRSE